MPLSYAVCLSDSSEALLGEDLCSISFFEDHWRPAALQHGLSHILQFPEGMSISMPQIDPLLDEVAVIATHFNQLTNTGGGGLIELDLSNHHASPRVIEHRAYLLEQCTQLRSALLLAKRENAVFSIG